MKRDLYKKLMDWKRSRNRKPLVLRGARQVGKTWLIKTFGEKEFHSYLYLNFEEDRRLNEFFQPSLNPKTILNNLSLYLNVTIDPESTLLVFDEIQESPAALNSLKYFQEKASEYYVVAAGSLLGVKVGKANGFPVGKVNFMDLYPLTFFEFIYALGKEKLANHLLQLNKSNDIAIPIHEELLALLKIYMVVGGMPEAVQCYLDTSNFSAVRVVQKEILDSYALDFAKHAPSEMIMKITKVWESIPAQLAKENKKFKWSDVQANARAREYATTVEWLADAGLIYRTFLVSTPRFPLTAYSENDTFKIYLLDVGLLGAMSNLSPQIILEGDALFTEFKGEFTENLVSQTLTADQMQLYYWSSEGRAEIDFIVEYENKIYPLEVKSGTSDKKKSLRVYADKFKPILLLRTSQLNLKLDGQVINIPLYLLGCLTKLITH